MLATTSYWAVKPVFKKEKWEICCRIKKLSSPSFPGIQTGRRKHTTKEMGNQSDDKSSPLSSPKEEEEEEESPVRAISVLKIKEDMKRFEEKEDCFILDFDPSESLGLSKISLEKNLDAVDLSLVAEKGPVACRDYPHARHLCLKFRFTTTAHESYCEMCYCYVCDTAAPCKYWTSTTRHCDADGAGPWKNLRKAMVKY